MSKQGYTALQPGLSVSIVLQQAGEQAEQQSMQVDVRVVRCVSVRERRVLQSISVGFFFFFLMFGFLLLLVWLVCLFGVFVGWWW